MTQQALSRTKEETLAGESATGETVAGTTELLSAEAKLAERERALAEERLEVEKQKMAYEQRVAALYSQAEILGKMADRSLLDLPSIDTDDVRLAANRAREAAIAARQAWHAAETNVITKLRTALYELDTRSQLLEKSLRRATDQKAAEEKANEKMQAAQQRDEAAAAPVVAKPSLAPVPEPVGAQRRQTPRVQMQAEVDLFSESNLFTGFSTNISSGGLFVATVENLELGTEIDLEFTLPDSIPVKTKAVVKWVQEINDLTPELLPGMGLQFVDLHPTARLALDQFIAQREPLFYPMEG